MRKSDKKRVLNEVAQKLESAMDSSTPQEYYERLTRIDTDELLKNGYSGIAKQLHKLQDKCYDMQSEGLGRYSRAHSWFIQQNYQYRRQYQVISIF